jgi:serine/threonine protein kinase
MGVVHKAEDTKLHRTAALKFLRPDSVEDEELTTRFRHEAEAARRRIRHAKAICRRELGATREPTRSSTIGSE